MYFAQISVLKLARGAVCATTEAGHVKTRYGSSSSVLSFAQTVVEPVSNTTRARHSITALEFQLCQDHGVTSITEARIG